MSTITTTLISNVPTGVQLCCNQCVTLPHQVRCQGSFQEVLSLGMVPLPLLEVVHMGDSPLQEDMELHLKQVGMVPHPQQVGTEPNPQQVVMEPHPQQVGMVPLLLLVDMEHSMVVMVPSILRSSHHSKAMQLKVYLSVITHTGINKNLNFSCQLAKFACQAKFPFPF